jgi:iron-regulated transporter 1
MEVRKSVSHLYEEQGKEETNNNNTASAISFREYVEIRTFPITLSMGILYINALSFGGTMTSYLVLIDYSSGLLGIMKAVAGIVGVTGTFAQPLLARRLGNMCATLWSVWQSLTLGLVVLALTDRLGNRTATSILLFRGMAASRLGLWIFDITESLILQEYTAAAHY